MAAPFQPAPLTANALAVLERRYLAGETPDQMFRRVAAAVAEAERGHGADDAGVAAVAERFYQRMAGLELLPNSPALMNAGRSLGQLAACFVVPVEDSTESIFDAVKYAALIQRSGGGTGFAFSRLRPAGDLVDATGGIASGPVSFMEAFDTATKAIKQGGARRGANMGVLRVDHPDILDFIAVKLDPTAMQNFNLSVAVTDAFMDAVDRGDRYALINPRTGREVRRIEARRVLDLIVNVAWATGDPGLLFLDRINRDNPTPELGAIEATNPCVTGDTRVLVEDAGWIPIRELVGRAPRVASRRDGETAFLQAAQVVCTGVRPVVRITTLEGYELRLTAEHRVATDRGDVAAEDLERGDRVPIPRLAPGPVSRSSRAARLGEVVGWLTGDGHFTMHGEGKPTAVLSFYGADKREAGPRLLEHVRELIGDSRPGLNTLEARDCQYIRSARLRTELRERGVDERCKTAVPELVWRGDRDLVAGYLRGLFSADGGVQGKLAKGISVRLSSNQRGLLRGVQLLLLRLGVASTLYANRRTASARLLPDGRGGTSEYPCAANHELVVSRSSLRVFADAVGFVVADKADRLASLLARHERGPYRDRFYATVADVEPEGEEEVYDLSEPHSRHFFADGLLIHNCGEQPLLPYESCVLASVNLARMVDDGQIAWDRLRAVVRDGVLLLDDIIDVTKYPLPQIAAITRANRKIGLGVMGLADLFIELRVPYDSEEALALGGRIAQVVEEESLAASAELAAARGAFASWGTSRWAGEGGYPRPLRNATTTTVAPTGTISIIAGCSSGIEPLYAVAYERHVLDGEVLIELHPAFRRIAERDGFWSDELARAIARRGRVRGLDAIPADVQALFATAHDVAPELHIRMQAAFQRHCHSAVSKTVNLPEHATAADLARIYRLAHELGCKGVTAYRDRSKAQQVLSFGEPATELEPAARTNAHDTCPECGAPLRHHGRCTACTSCGWSVCA